MLHLTQITLHLTTHVYVKFIIQQFNIIYIKKVHTKMATRVHFQFIVELKINFPAMCTMYINFNLICM